MTPEIAEMERVPLFATLTLAQLEHLRPRVDVEPFSAGQVLVHEGRHGYAFYVLHEGEAEVTVEGRVVGQLRRHDFFGEVAILGDGHRHATVTATTDGVAWVLFGTTFRELEKEHPEIASTINDRAAERVAAGS